MEIFDISKRTCLCPDWSQQGIGYFLSRKHCSCNSNLPNCCTEVWQITLALAVAWVWSKPSTSPKGATTCLLGDRTLDEITNTRLLHLKQRALLWRFEISYLPEKTNLAADATSRHPASCSNIHSTMEDEERAIAAAIHREAKEFTTLSWDRLANKTSTDPNMHRLMDLIEAGFRP